MRRPDAPLGLRFKGQDDRQVPSMPLMQEPIRGMVPSRTRSSCSEIVESMDELQEITLLVNGTGAWLIEMANSLYTIYRLYKLYICYISIDLYSRQVL